MEIIFQPILTHHLSQKAILSGDRKEKATRRLTIAGYLMAAQVPYRRSAVDSSETTHWATSRSRFQYFHNNIPLFTAANHARLLVMALFLLTHLDAVAAYNKVHHRFDILCDIPILKSEHKC